MEGRKKKICFVNTCKSWGGGEKWHLEAACSLDTDRFEAHVLAAPGSALAVRAKNAGLPVFTANVGNLGFLNPILMSRLKRYFRRGGFHAVVLNLPSDLKSSGRAAKAAGVPNIIYRRGSAIPIKDTALNRYLFSRIIDRVIANSVATKKSILANNPSLIGEDKIHILRNGIDPGKYHVVKHANKHTIVFGNLGRMVKQKGQEMLIDTARYLDHLELDFIVLIGGSGPLHDDLAQKIKEDGLEDRVKILGHQDDPVAFMQLLDVFLLPSRWEGFGYVIAEAMASGLPVVAFDMSSNPELVGHAQTGYLARAFDIQSFAEHAARLAGDTDLRRKMGKKAREVIELQYDIRQSNRQLEAFLG